MIALLLLRCFALLLLLRSRSCKFAFRALFFAVGVLTLVCRLLRCCAFVRRTNKINARLCALQKIVRLRDCALVRSCARAALMRLRLCTLLRLRAQIVRVRSGYAYALSLHPRLRAPFALARSVCACAHSLR